MHNTHHHVKTTYKKRQPPKPVDHSTASAFLSATLASSTASTASTKHHQSFQPIAISSSDISNNSSDSELEKEQKQKTLKPLKQRVVALSSSSKHNLNSSSQKPQKPSSNEFDFSEEPPSRQRKVSLMTARSSSKTGKALNALKSARNARGKKNNTLSTWDAEKTFIHRLEDRPQPVTEVIDLVDDDEENAERVYQFPGVAARERKKELSTKNVHVKRPANTDACGVKSVPSTAPIDVDAVYPEESRHDRKESNPNFASTVLGDNLEEVASQFSSLTIKTEIESKRTKAPMAAIPKSVAQDVSAEIDSFEDSISRAFAEVLAVNVKSDQIQHQKVENNILDELIPSPMIASNPSNTTSQVAKTGNILDELSSSSMEIQNMPANLAATRLFDLPSPGKPADIQPVKTLPGNHNETLTSDIARPLDELQSSTEAQELYIHPVTSATTTAQLSFVNQEVMTPRVAVVVEYFSLLDEYLDSSSNNLHHSTNLSNSVVVPVHEKEEPLEVNNHLEFNHQHQQDIIYDDPPNETYNCEPSFNGNDVSRQSSELSSIFHEDDTELSVLISQKPRVVEYHFTEEELMAPVFCTLLPAESTKAADSPYLDQSVRDENTTGDLELERSLDHNYGLSQSTELDNKDDQTPHPVVQHSQESPKSPPSSAKKLTKNHRRSFGGSNSHDILTSLEHDEATLEELLQVCGQSKPITFESAFNLIKKLGEATFSEVYSFTTHAFGEKSNKQNPPKPLAVKVMPFGAPKEIEELHVNGSPQISLHEVTQEVLITKALSEFERERSVSVGDGVESNFVQLVSLHICQGEYSEALLEVWDDWAETKDSENDRPDFFPETQLYVVIVLANGGTDLEHFKIRPVSTGAAPCTPLTKGRGAATTTATPNKTWAMVFSIIHQTILALHVAERDLHFEHRDLHWGNILCQPDVKYVGATKEYFISESRGSIRVSLEGVKVTIIDYTLSRCETGRRLFFNKMDDESFYCGEGDYQFDIYRMMRQETQGDWKSFHPKTNVFWIHYLIHKLLKGKSLPTAGPVAKEKRKLLDLFQKRVLGYKSVGELVERDELFSSV
ncbi:UNVERIFIED_CONTAM: Serine/threonine-protein kinase haspin [Siphonaria sp. JEL0065]|nr:Serine/threonine-protein kinase haspin [Siphonaria sp. JEL0065]